MLRSKWSTNALIPPVTSTKRSNIVNYSELKVVGVKELTETMVTTIKSNQNFFHQLDLGGYIIQVSGKPYLSLENSSEGIKKRSGRVTR